MLVAILRTQQGAQMLAFPAQIALKYTLPDRTVAGSQY